MITREDIYKQEEKFGYTLDEITMYIDAINYCIEHWTEYLEYQKNADFHATWENNIPISARGCDDCVAFMRETEKLLYSSNEDLAPRGDIFHPYKADWLKSKLNSIKMSTGSSIKIISIKDLHPNTRIIRIEFNGKEKILVSCVISDFGGFTKTIAATVYMPGKFPVKLQNRANNIIDAYHALDEIAKKLKLDKIVNYNVLYQNATILSNQIACVEDIEEIVKQALFNDFVGLSRRLQVKI